MLVGSGFGVRNGRGVRHLERLGGEVRLELLLVGGALGEGVYLYCGDFARHVHQLFNEPHLNVTVLPRLSSHLCHPRVDSGHHLDPPILRSPIPLGIRDLLQQPADRSPQSSHGSYRTCPSNLLLGWSQYLLTAPPERSRNRELPLHGIPSGTRSGGLPRWPGSDVGGSFQSGLSHRVPRHLGNSQRGSSHASPPASRSFLLESWSFGRGSGGLLPFSSVLWSR